MATLHIVRGLPGSGKTTFAKKLASELGCKHFEADMFFTDENGNYNFDINRIGDAHEWCHDSAMEELRNGNDVIVSNTFTVPRNIAAYVSDPFIVDEKIVSEYSLVIYEMTGQFGNIHGVPEETLQRMAKQWTSNEELKSLLETEVLRWFIPIEFRTINS